MALVGPLRHRSLPISHENTQRVSSAHKLAFGSQASARENDETSSLRPQFRNDLDWAHQSIVKVLELAGPYQIFLIVDDAGQARGNSIRSPGNVVIERIEKHAVEPKGDYLVDLTENVGLPGRIPIPDEP
jgi:hypothetical protein